MKFFGMILLSLAAFYLPQAWAELQSESFIVRSFNHHVEVVAPKKFHPDQVIKIENKTIEDLIGVVQTHDGQHKRSIRVKPNRSINVSLPHQEGQHYVFIPQSPPFQEVELVIGREVYEIPEKR